jgi:Uma2 family endonuclease
MSVREFLRLPEEKPYLEYINGVVEQKPMVNAEHRRIVGRLDMKFGGYAEAQGGDFGPEGRVDIAGTDDYMLPDTAFWAVGVPSGDDSVPTLAVEVRSPDQSLPKLREKCRAYVRSGSATAWLIDPGRRVVETFDHDGVQTLKAGAVLTCDAMPGFALPISELFS